MFKDITFINKSLRAPKEFNPIPANKALPEWYKKTNSYLDDEKKPIIGGDSTRSTIKKCIPVFDAISMGYLILLPHDVYIEFDGFEYSFSIPHGASQINHHPLFQAELHPDKKEDHAYIPKFMNPWIIKTPPGYSSMIIPPMHRENIIQILPGVVDTDKYEDLINLPFIVSKSQFTGLIEAGTPIAQVIPFKRNSWRSKNISSDEQLSNSVSLVKSVFFEGYKKFIWVRKIFK